MNAIAINKNIDQEFDISFENGSIVRELKEESFLKHNLLCFGRLNNNSTKDPTVRIGDLISFFEDSEIFSISWAYFRENNINFNTITKIIEKFNKACDRDFNNGLLDHRIKMINITKLGRNNLLFKVIIGDIEQEITINI